MNKILSIVKDAAKKVFAGKAVGRAIDVAERGVQLGETAVKAIMWVKIVAGLLVLGIVAVIATIVVVSIF